MIPSTTRLSNGSTVCHKYPWVRGIKHGWSTNSNRFNIFIVNIFFIVKTYFVVFIVKIVFRV